MNVEIPRSRADAAENLINYTDERIPVLGCQLLAMGPWVSLCDGTGERLPLLKRPEERKVT